VGALAASCSLLVIAAAALVIVDLFAILGDLEPWIYSVFFLVTAVWLGLSLPRWSTTWLAPALAAPYVLPLLHDGRSGACSSAGAAERGAPPGALASVRSDEYRR
jgi:hypothetical protein